METEQRNYSKPVALCPHCGTPANRHSHGVRRPRDLGGRVVVVRYSKHRCDYVLCERRGKFFSSPMPGLVPNGRYTEAVRHAAVAFYRDGLSLDATRERMHLYHKVEIPQTTLFDWITETKGTA